jgi:hypothetical protein
LCKKHHFSRLPTRTCQSLSFCTICHWWSVSPDQRPHHYTIIIGSNVKQFIFRMAKAPDAAPPVPKRGQVGGLRRYPGFSSICHHAAAPPSRKDAAAPWLIHPHTWQHMAPGQDNPMPCASGLPRLLFVLRVSVLVGVALPGQSGLLPSIPECRSRGNESCRPT